MLPSAGYGLLGTNRVITALYFIILRVVGSIVQKSSPPKVFLFFFVGMDIVGAAVV